MTWAVGIDAGGTKIASGLVDLELGKVVERRLAPTPAAANEVLEATIELAEAVAGTLPISCLGIGLPEIVSQRGEISSSTNWALTADEVRTRLAVVAPTWIEADVRAASLAEARFGAGIGLQCFVYLSIGTNISACVVYEGHPWPGKSGAAGIVGVPPIEETAGGRALARNAGVLTALEVLEDPRHDGRVEAATLLLGEEVARIVNLIDPEALVVGGSLGLNEEYRRRWVDHMRNAIWFPLSADLPVVPAFLGVDAGVIGAALAAAQGFSV